MKHPKHWLKIALTAIILLIAGFGAFVWYGVYNVSALAQHTAPIYRMLQFAMVRSVASRSEAKPPGELDERNWRVNGLLQYQQHCQQCHGAPGVAPEEFSLGMVPAPTAIAEIGRKRKASEIFWVVKHGIKMSGMPAWDYRMRESEMWDVVAFVKQIPRLTVEDYQSLKTQAQQSGLQDTGPAHASKNLAQDSEEKVRRGKIALQQYNCTSCHEIPGVTAARNYVGPPLGGITRRTFISGELENTPENLIRWIRFPQQVSPNSTMPDLNVSETHAQEMVAYLRFIDEQEPDEVN